MGLMLQIILQLMNLCIIFAAIGFSRSSAFGELLSLESSSPFPSTEAQVPSSVVEQGPFVYGSVVQPPPEVHDDSPPLPPSEPPIKTPPVHQLIKGPPPLLSPKPSTALPPQPLHVPAPQLPAEPPKSSVLSTAKAPQCSNSPAELPHDGAPPLPVTQPPPHHSSPPSSAEPSYVSRMTPVEPPRVSGFPPAAKAPVAIPQLPTAEPPEALPLASSPSPPQVPEPISTIPSPPLPSAGPPLSTIPANVSSNPSPQPSVAKPPLSSALPLAAKPPEYIPQLPAVIPPAFPPRPSPIQSPPLSQNASSSHPHPSPFASSPPLPSAGPPLSTIASNVSSHASPQPSVAKPPLSSALPLPAKPPESNPQLPAVIPPALPPHPSDMQSSPPSQNASSSLPQPSPFASYPPPQLVSPNAPPPVSIVNPHASVSPPQDPPATLPSSSPPSPLNVVSPLPSQLPPIVSSPPPQIIPPIVSVPPPQLTPPIVSLPPPRLTPSIASSPPPQLIPPIEYAPSPQLTPPIVYSPPLQLIPPIESAPPQLISPIVPASPPGLTPPIVSSPPPQLTPPIESADPQLTPPIIYAPPPESTPPMVSSSPPQLIPPIESSPPQLTPPITSPPQLTPPVVSPPQLTPPIVSPPQLITPPASPTPAVPSNASLPPASFLTPPQVPLSPLPHASPPMPSHAVSPLPQPTKPHAPYPPYDLSAPPPVELPHIFPPHSPIVPTTVPPYPSLPSPYLTPPLAPASPVIPSRPSSAPPPSFVPPPPAMQQTVTAPPPRSSQRKEKREGAPPPLLTSPGSSPSSKALPESPPPAHQVTPRSYPPNSHEAEAPNASEPFTLPSSAPSPSKDPVGVRYPSTAPPGRAPDPSPGDKPSTYPAAAEPATERHDPTAPSPLSFSISPTSNGSRHTLHHSRVKGPSTPMAPLPSPPEMPEISPSPSSLPGAPLGHSRIPVPSPRISPSESSTRNTKRPLASPIRSLPPPPPNADCAYMTCDEPLTNTPPGSPCGCVWPMQVGMRLGVALYTFFPLVSELAREIAAGVYMHPNQVRVMGANATTEELDKTIVIVNLVPLHEKFDNPTALVIFQRFWHKQIVIDKSLFGDYDILYVRYPGLPPSPPMAPADIAIINGMPYTVGDPNKVHPLGVDVTKQRHKRRLNGVIIAAVVFSATVALLICCFVAWLLVFRHTNNEPQPAEIPRALPSLGRSSGPTGNSTGSGPSSSLSIQSSLPPYTGSAKTFSASEIEKATDNLNPSRIIGEGGFGLVYSGVLEDTTHVAVKVLKRDDQQGGREFLAEVEMLSRLHHRNLVKLIGICTDEHLRCLVYELIPNGSVESHLHGRDKETAPLDWASRMKIALGAARGLAYLHEDSSPRVIHRDFKSSNILLENDFTPKVSDFGLARAAMDGENRHISTRVMGTFGYVAPEYAMTGHLLVKSDVYSYGVVLLEILTGRKPVDMLQPPGQENLVAWAKPFLSTQEGLELILDPYLGTDVPLDSVAKVAAIASMCVQPEVSHRPFMGEVVQALKLVCNESDDSKDSSFRHGSHGNLSVDFDAKGSPISDTQDNLPSQFSDKNHYPGLDLEKGVSVSEIFGASVRTDRQASDSFRRHSASGPLKTERSRPFWQRIRRLSNGGSVSEHGIMYRLWAGS